MSMPPIQYLLDFADDPDALLDWLLESAAWDDRMRSRRTASFGAAYDYSQIAYPDTPMPPRFDALCIGIEAALGFRPNNCLVNDYPDGESKMGFHADQIDRMMPNTGVAIVSLGATRRMTFRLRNHTARHEIALAAGSLLYMPTDMQSLWQHAIPPEPGAGRRVSLSFRQLT